jgi:hypothetical protein
MNIPTAYTSNQLKNDTVVKKYSKEEKQEYDEVLKKEYNSKKKKNYIKVGKVTPRQPDPDNFFLLNYYSENYVSLMEFDNKTIIEKIEKIIFTPNTIHLKDVFEELKQNNRIYFGKRNINNLFIFITTEQSWLGVAGTLVNKLQQYYNRIKHTKTTKSIDYIYEKIDSIAVEYKFFIDINALEDPNYKALAPIIKDIFKLSWECIENNNYINNINAVKNLYNILSKIGYNQEGLSKKIVFQGGTIDKLKQQMTIEKLAFLSRLE